MLLAIEAKGGTAIPTGELDTIVYIGLPRVRSAKAPAVKS